MLIGFNGSDASFSCTFHFNLVVFVRSFVEPFVLQRIPRYVFIIVLFLFIVVGLAPRGHSDPELAWTDPLSKFTNDAADRALVVILITDDVAEQWPSRPGKAMVPNSDACWCARPFAKTAQNIPEGFFHPSAPITWQHWPLGLPGILTGGDKVTASGRIIVVVTDGDYRILGFSVGIPDDDELTRLIEDAEDTRTLMQAHHRQPELLVQALVERSSSRISRLWRITLDQQLTAMGKTPQRNETDELKQNDHFTRDVQLRLGLIAVELQNVYEKDIELRFGLKLPGDAQRLISLEQHSTTRMDWTQCLNPFIIGGDIRSLHLDLAEIVWNQRVIAVQPSDSEALTHWIAVQGKEQSFVLQIPLPVLAARQASQLAEVSPAAERRGLGWNRLEETLRKCPIRQVNVNELASWLLNSGGRPLDLRRPSQTRYLFFRSAADHPYPIRDGDPPGRSITMIRQVQK